MKYLFAGIFSTIVMSIYTMVDSICIGQYEGATGSAAIACGIPVWTLIYSSGLLCGVGGATLMMVHRGKNNYKRGNQIFTTSLICAIVLSLILYLIMFLFQKPLLIFFGAKDENVLDLITKYTFWLKVGLPFFFFSQFLTVFVRNDEDPLRASIAVVGGGIVNAILDFALVFGANMGISGAGLATFIGQVFTVLILLTHFMSKKNKLKLTKPTYFISDSSQIVLTGLSSFLLDICMGITTIIFNNQITNYGGVNATVYLSVYGVIINMVTLVQSLGYSVGQASQPLLSENVGKKDFNSLKQYFKYGIISTIIIGIILFGIFELFTPNLLTLFAKAGPYSKEMILGEKACNIYYISFLFVVFNVYSIYYFNSILKKSIAFIIAIGRGLILPMLFLFTLPKINFDLIWVAMILVEGIITIISIFFIYGC